MQESPDSLLIKISPLLREKLHCEDGDLLKKQLADLQSFQYDLAILRCDTYADLLKSRERHRMPRGKEYTELDRKTIMESSISRVEADYELLLQLEQIVSEKISLGMIFLQTLN